MALDSSDNLYLSVRNGENKVYKLAPSHIDRTGTFQPGELIGWLGKCDPGLSEPGQCDAAQDRSIGFSCTDDTCQADTSSGDGLGQFNDPRGIAIDPNDVLYVTDFNNMRVQRFTPEGFFAGEAVSECDGSCFVLGDFGRPRDVTVNSNQFYVLDRDADLLHVLETTPITDVTETSATVVYVSDYAFIGEDGFTFTATDGLRVNGELVKSQLSSVDITVVRTPNEEPPIARQGLEITTAEDTPIVIALGGSDPDGPFDRLQVEVEQPERGSLSRYTPDGNAGDTACQDSAFTQCFEYMPNPDFAGEDRFTFVVRDGKYTSESASVSLIVTPVNNDPPRVMTAPSMQAGVGFSVAYMADILDPDTGDAHTISIDWGDGMVESEPVPMMVETSQGPMEIMTGPMLVQSPNGNGMVTASHVYMSPGPRTVTVCATDATQQQTCNTTDITVSTGSTDLGLGVTRTSDMVAVGQTAVYELTMTNLEPVEVLGVEASGVVLTYELEPGVILNAANSDQGECRLANRTVTCDIGRLAVGQSVTVAIEVTPNDVLAVGTVLSQMAQVTADQDEHFVDNNVTETRTVVVE